MEKRLDIEEFVKNNLELFNDEEPSEAHFERFRLKLKGKSKIKSLINRSLKYAAIFIFLITGFVSVYYFNLFQNKKYQAESINNEEDFGEVISFYDMQLNQKQNELNNLTCKNSDEQKKLVTQDLSELRNSFMELKNELNANPDNPNIKNAIINNFQTQIEVLSIVIKNLQAYC
jgi:hypothetical protein